MNKLSERIELALQWAAIPISELIQRGSPSRATLWRLTNDPKYTPEPYTLERLAKALGVSYGWLSTGKGAMSSIDPIEFPMHPGTDGETVWMPVFAPKPSAGNGNHVHLEDSEESMPFSAPYLHSLGVSPREAFILKVDGDSMEPALRHGEHVMVDRSAAAQDKVAAMMGFRSPSGPRAPKHEVAS